ncbi:MAG: YeeE/YedE family protein [Chloroflexota bacterium]|nr:YeeE/YedE family protein [Chloroflexota bacterium]
MSETVIGGSRAAAPALLSGSRGAWLRVGLALVVCVGLVGGAYLLHDTAGYGAKASFYLLIGAALGITFARGRFCFFCILRDWIEKRDSTGMFAILAALAVGGVGYAVVFGAFLPNAFSGRLPPDAHIGPVSWVLLAAGLAFGFGMTLSGACISGHLYRLGEGYSRAPLALFGAAVGFGLGFFTWQSVYLGAIRSAPVAWLPATFGYGGALALHLAVLVIFGIILLRYLPSPTPPANQAERLTLARLARIVFQQRWNPLVTGAIVGLLGMFAYFRVEPLGVTSQIGSLSRTALDNAGLLAERLNGLDTFAGCATQVVQTITENGWLIGGLVLGSFAVSLLANRFQISALTFKSSLTALGGGVLMGWGSMLALGCTVGTLLSGMSAFAVSGWVFAAAVIIGVWASLRLKLAE